jgi:poly-gamma-glutamate synthesis protein (capsule biosynthesis protein)
MHRGRAFFHGLGNFVTVTRALTPVGNDSPEREAWARRRKELYGFAPDPDMPFYPFHPESRNTVIAVCRFTAGGVVSAGFAPCWIDDAGRPVPLSRVDGARVADYVARIGEEAGLDTAFAWDGDEVVLPGVGRAG